MSDKTEDSLPPQVESVSALQTTAGIETEADKLTAQTVTERLNDITKRASKARRAGTVGSIALWLCMTVALPSALRHLKPTSFLNFPYIILALVVYVFAIHLLLRVCSQTIPRFDAQEIARMGGVKAVVPLLVAFQPASRKQRKEVEAALTMLLPQMKASDAHLLTSDARNQIQRWLGKYVNTAMDISCPDELRIAALKALEQVGNSDDIELVERLANLKARSPAKARVKQAAIECLPMLREHCGEVASARTLLRASNAEDARPDTLLRAATGLPETSPAELLRGAKKP